MAQISFRPKNCIRWTRLCVPFSISLCAYGVHQLNLPKKLYKYESISVQSLQNLKKQIVYFAPPSGFNDPYDCALRAEIEELDDKGIEKVREIYLSKKWPDHVKKQLEDKSIDELKLTLERVARCASEDVIEKFVQCKGVSCFSEVNDELLMWAHYSEKYSGFCLEFDTNNELFEKARKVTYMKNMPKLNIVKLFADGERGDILNKLFCTKSKSWKYEKEWRCIHSVAGTAFTYPAEHLTGVYFGPKVNNTNLEIICLILQGQNDSVRFWKSKKSETKFKLDFEEFTYTPDIKSK